MDTTVKTQDSNGPVAQPVSAAAGLQPFLHDAVVTLYAPSLVISRADGQLAEGADGFYHGDRRALSHLTVAVEGVFLAPVAGGFRGADRADFRAVLRGLGETTPDPAVALHRRRSVTAGRFEERLEVTNAGTRRIRFRLRVTAGTDLATMEQVKSGRTAGAVPPQAADADAVGLSWSRGGFTARLLSESAPDALELPAGRLTYDVELAPGASWSVTLHGTAAYADGDQFPPAPADQVPWSTPVLRSADRRLDRWLEQSLADLDRLRLTDPQSRQDGPDQFLAAGAPWFLTLFGRDALWAARMLLPLGTNKLA